MNTLRLMFMRMNDLLFRSRDEGEVAALANRTFLLCLLCYTLEGLALGIYSSYVIYALKKAADASDLLVVMAAMCGPAGLLVSWPVGYYFEGRSKKPLFLTAALLFVVAGVGFAVSKPGIIFIPLILLFSVGDAIRLPGRNAILQTNVPARERARFLGGLYVLMGVATIVSTFVSGAVMDASPDIHRMLFPLGLLLFALSCMIFLRIPTTPRKTVRLQRFTIMGIWRPFVDLVKLLNIDRRFLWFEIGFFLYGSGFMVVAAILPIYYSEQFNASYTQFGITSVIVNALMLMSPLVGTWGDRGTPLKLCAAAFLVLSMYPVFLLFVPNIWFAYGAHAWYSLGMIGVYMGWNIGPIFFAAKRDASSYIGLHAFLVAIRALVAFPIAGWLKESTSSFTPVLILAATLFFLGAVVMAVLHVKLLKSGEISSTRSGRFEMVEKGRE